MKRILQLFILCGIYTFAQAQHVFQNISLSKALIELDNSSQRYSISFVYDELEDFTVSKTIRRGCSLPDAVREVCGFYPIRVSTKGNEIFVECMQKDQNKLIGRLVSSDGKPVVYANIVLYGQTDSVLINGGVSNEAGDFVIPCNATQARVHISCVGFKTIERQMPISNVGTIRMQMENNYLGNVNVNGRIPVVRSEADRLQYIVSNDEFAKGHSVLELLNRVPMVSMAGGRAMILGKGPANYMLNGRVIEMGHEAIQQKLWTMRAEDVERIEVISIPSGRYQADSGSGYINIVLQRDQTLGWTGDVSTQAGVSDDWSGRASASVSYASEKFDMMADVNGGRTTHKTDETAVYPFDMVGISDSHTKQQDKEVATNLMFRYLPAECLELGGMLSYQILWPEKIIDGTFSYNNQSLWSETKLSPCDNTNIMNLTAYGDWRIDTKGKKLSLTYNNYKKKEDVQTGVTYETPFLSTSLNWNGSDVDYHIQSGRFDLSLPFDIVNIDAGISYTCIKNEGSLSISSSEYGYWNRINHYSYHEKTKTTYLSFHREWDKYTINAGLRYEHIGLDRDENGDYEYNNVKYDTSRPFEVFRRGYWLPSFGISVMPQDGHKISLSWGKSIIRPNFYDLNPLYIYKTGYESMKGNPELEPSRTSQMELRYHNNHGLLASVYHHHTSNVVEWNYIIGEWYAYGVGSNNVMTVSSSPANRGRINKTGLYLHYQCQPAANLLVTAEGDAYYYDYKYKAISIIPYGMDALAKEHISKLHEWGKRLAISADWYLNHQRTLLLNARYQHCFSDYQIENKIDDYGYFDFALRYSMLNDRLRLSLVTNDPFHQYITNDTWYSISHHINHHAHYIGLAATYSIGSKKVCHIQRDKKDTESQRAIRKQ